ncbi:MAG: hypothetical protein AAB340_00600 [Patescibacteria group bacterium]
MKFYETKKRKRLIGVFAIIVGFTALVTPFTPGAAWLIFIGLQLLGLHFVFLDKIEKFLGIDKFTKKL